MRSRGQQQTAATRRVPTATDHAGGGLVLERYRLDRRLGAGGFGVVWLAFDERLEREVAVKVIPGDGDDSWRAEREARVAARLNHPGIVALYEMGDDGSDLYLVSELVRGRTMGELRKAGALADRDLARIGAALCDALGHAHARGVIHRDVKPQNVMVVAEPAAGAGFAKLTDFGVAHMAGGDPLTRTGDVVGTLAYMAPEQAEGHRVTPACDVYSLALCLYEGWTGRNPVRAAGPAATARRLGRPLPALESSRPDLPAELCETVDAALDPDPGFRPPVHELGKVLSRAEPELDDEGGLVEPETLRRFGLTAVRTRTLAFRRRGRPARDAEGKPRHLPRLVLTRLGAGAAAGLLVLVALAELAPIPPFSPVAAAGAVAVLVALLPRLGWIAGAAALCGWLASPDAGREGTALVLAAALVPVPLLMPRAGELWSVPVLAPLLGLIAIGPMFVAVAGLARTAWRRAGLAAAGMIWLVAGEALGGRALLFGTADGTLPRSDWQDSVGGAASHALSPALTSPVLAPALAWVAFATILPFVVRGRVLALDLVGAGLWATGLAAALVGMADVIGASTQLDQARGAVAGPVLGALVAVAVSAMAPPETQEDVAPATAS
jgi:eukaryotic-like serine/threonine-protein kinase